MRIIATIVATFAFLGGSMLIAPSASADTEGCVTRREVSNIHKGWKMKRVHRLFDVKGRVSSVDTGFGRPTMTRAYDPCPRFSFIDVTYKKRRSGVWRVSSKSAFFA